MGTEHHNTPTFSVVSDGYTDSFCAGGGRVIVECIRREAQAASDTLPLLTSCSGTKAAKDAA